MSQFEYLSPHFGYTRAALERALEDTRAGRTLNQAELATGIHYQTGVCRDVRSSIPIPNPGDRL